ncbi:hypothetical protein [Mycobacteroides abscessus]|uniref:hypothetical protein n=1 Tax=Mycobacteroides abscessus TaxID=36809 RepID=UPI0010543C23|nr:hypothetical protein [Mycobacteroides abscessus]MBN7527480.1 hypothetical protein [Mycobacteroides abscessus subsp. massiliense]MDM3940793.1 hypothetical protein [Mycobacteroides abscessus]MDO3056768.1 hypothetical protein [Mycobacteroides abscessus subsp. massiliense]
MAAVGGPNSLCGSQVATFHCLVEFFLASFGEAVDSALKGLGEVGRPKSGLGRLLVLGVVSLPQAGVLVVRGEQGVACLAGQSVGELWSVMVLRSVDCLVEVPGNTGVELVELIEEPPLRIKWSTVLLDRHRERAVTEVASGARCCAGGTGACLGRDIGGRDRLMEQLHSDVSTGLGSGPLGTTFHSSIHS